MDSSSFGFEDIKFCNCRKCRIPLCGNGQTMRIKLIWHKLNEDQKRVCKEKIGGRMNDIPYCRDCFSELTEKDYAKS